MEITIKQPYNDKDLEFNELTGHYQLTLECVKANFDDTFKDDGVMQKRIVKNSRVVYNYIYGRGYTQNNRVITFFLNKTKEGRRFIKDLLLSQIESDLETASNDIGIIPGVATNGQIIDRNQIRANLVSVQTEQVADNNAVYFGFNLLIQTMYPWMIYQFVERNS